MNRSLKKQNPRSLGLSRVCWISPIGRENSVVPGTGLEPASRKAADFRHTTSFDAARIALRAFVRWTMPSP
ncbi:hypothetical protein ACFPTO_01990 [Paraburkholderia denitrificans]|uniref:Uncharacterized protein n=1 Tax=Paraburkholderia denitrificans TaxID=694025 RepID=A0ABW0J3J4_9BURK